MSRAFKDLHPALRPLCVEFIARCAEARIPVYVIDTLRTEKEHKQNLKKGVSWIKRSKHLYNIVWFKSTGEKRSRAFDCAPWEQFNLHGPDKLNFDADDPVWQIMGKIGEQLGLKWGGRWKPKRRRDMGHFELPDNIG